MNKNQMIHRDCTEYCKSVDHGDIITAAITKRSISDLELCSYLNYICTNCESVKDSLGRSALQVAASCGRVGLIRWLVTIRNANINLKDEESGYTAFHRAMFYGKIDAAVELIRLGATSSIYDLDGLTPIEHATIDGTLPAAKYGNMYTWGLNKNNTIGSFNSRPIPEILENFHKRHPHAYVKEVYLNKFHTVILTSIGKVYSCGHGLGGRLGLGTEKSVFVPTKVYFTKPDNAYIAKVSIARDHCLFLACDHTLYTCGLNTHKVLGVSPPPDKSILPVKIHLPAYNFIEGISTARYHSVVWTRNTIYTWGLNVGQLGHESVNGNYHVITPKRINLIKFDTADIKYLVSSDGAIAVASDRGDIYVLHEYQCRKIASRKMNIESIAVIGGKMNTSLDKDLEREPPIELKVVALTRSGNLYLWRESDPYLCRCVFSIPRQIMATRVAINIKEILFITGYGEAFSAVAKPRKRKTVIRKNDFHNFLIKDECVTLKLTKIPRIHRAVAITSDPWGDNYCVLQQPPYNEIITAEDTLPESTMKKQLAVLLGEAKEGDNIHDVKLIVGNKIFPAHKYVLARRSRILEKMCCDVKEVHFEDVNVDVFEQMLIYIYCGTCDLLQVGECPQKFKQYCTPCRSVQQKEDYVDKKRKEDKLIQNPVRMLQNISKRYGCTDLFNVLSNFDMDGYNIKKKIISGNDFVITYHIKNLPELYDVVIRCSDNKDIKAHKCILAARMEYFNSMFSVRWNSDENSRVKIPHPYNLVLALLEFVYTDSTEFLVDRDCDFLLRLLVMADEYLMEDLKEHCSKHILTASFLNLKNAPELLKVAHYYSATRLKEGVMLYIVNNMADLLETNALNDLDDIILSDLTQSYYKSKSQIGCRVVTPYSTAVSDEEIIHICDTYPVNIEIPERKKSEKTPPKSSKRRTKTAKNVIVENRAVNDVKSEKENIDSIIQFPDTSDIPEIPSQQHTCSNIQKRLSSITNARTTLEFEDYLPEYTNLRESVPTHWNSDFPLLNSPPQMVGLSSPPSIGKLKNKHEGKHKMVRLSQKERKRLSSENLEVVEVVPETKNPWKSLTVETAHIDGSPTSEAAFSAILSDERKQKENLVKVTNTLLKHAQKEDKAIMELEKFYNVDDIEDEVITVHRVVMENVASPTWVPRS